MDYTLEITRLLTILQSPTIPEEQKLIAENRLMEIKKAVTRSNYGVSEDRIDDVQELERIIANPFTPKHHRGLARQSLKKIVNESKAVKSMRERLIKEMKAGKADNVKDITEYVRKHSEYQ
jgi:hypothetical protein